MKLASFLLIGSSLIAVAQSQKGEPVAPISAAMAATNSNQSVVVTGTVAQVTIREKLVYVNLDKPHPQTPLPCVIFAKNTNQFALDSLKGKQVQITGKVTEHNGKPQIILSSTNQLKIVETKKD